MFVELMFFRFGLLYWLGSAAFGYFLVGKSDHVTLLVEFKVSNDPQYSQSEKKSWFKVDEEFVITFTHELAPLSWLCFINLFESGGRAS